MEEVVVTDDLLKQLYYNPSFGYSSPVKFHKKLVAEGYNVSFKRVKEWLAQQNAYQISKRPPIPKSYNSVVAPYPGANYQIDIMYQKKYKTNGGHKFVFVCIDVASRKLGLAAMKNRAAKAYIKAWRQVLKRYFKKVNEVEPVWPASVSCDREFVDATWVGQLEERGVNIWYSQPNQPNKNAIVERVIRTIRGYLKRWRWQNDDPNWDAFLPQLCYNYNHTWHRTIKQQPEEIWNGTASSHQVVKWVPAKRKLGERVRIVLRGKSDSPFIKSDERKVSGKVYTIVQRAPPNEGHRQFKWIVADEDTHHIVTEKKTDKPVRFLDYELVPVPHTHGTQAMDRVRVSQQVVQNVVEQRLEREELPGEVVRTNIPFVQLGTLGRPQDRTIHATIELPANQQPATLKRQSVPPSRFQNYVQAKAKPKPAPIEPHTVAYTYRRKRNK